MTEQKHVRKIGWKTLTLLVSGLGVLSVSIFDVLLYAVQAEWNKAIVILASWGLIGIGLTLTGIGLLGNAKLEQA